MKKAIQKYFEKLKDYPLYYVNEDFSDVSSEIKREFDKGTYLIERTTKTDISIFEKEFGYELPKEIKEYINLFWHPCISGYYNTREAVVLFPVLKKEGNSGNDLLFYKNGLIAMAENWSKIGGSNEFIPIGWLGHSGSYVLYDVKSNKIFLENTDIDGQAEIEPIANSLKELIDNLQITMQVKTE